MLDKYLNLNGPFHGDGKLIEKAWNGGNVEDCMKHNRACLLKEAEIWNKRYNFNLTKLKL